ncbi:hypothetical protein CTI12_AA194810 [Artemisia annua]|uniref:Uncharacterized protein n=1 Tax=Artemisia annua TaxID=35608 RepID=A0A2U1MCI1_ARTAN|nr:hypothetical protein CTI12_AA194810 [Artemisia annua]
MAVGALTVGCGPLFALGCVGKGRPWLGGGEVVDDGLCMIGVGSGLLICEGGLVGAVDEATGVSCPRFCDAANKACGELDVVFVDMVTMIEAYLRATNMFVDYSETQQERVYSSYLELDLSEVEPCIYGPKRPHDRAL